MIKELEVKVLNEDFNRLEKEIKSRGGKLIGKEIQVNTLIDSKDKSVEKIVDGYLRLRETTNLSTGLKDLTLTLKKNIENDNIRENLEINCQVDNKENILKILEELGFGKTEEGQKERTSYQLDNIRFDFDIWDKSTYPYPYMEIEVESIEDLRRISKLLKIKEENISTKSIVELRKEIKPL